MNLLYLNYCIMVILFYYTYICVLYLTVVLYLMELLSSDIVLYLIFVLYLMKLLSSDIVLYLIFVLYFMKLLSSDETLVI